MKPVIGILFLVMAFFTVSAQGYEDEALMYGRTGISGTARSMGSAGAYGAVGADMGTITINPAGLGLYRSNDFSLTPALQINNNESSFIGSSLNQSVPKVYINQAGAVFTHFIKKASKPNEISFNAHHLRSYSLAINYQRQSFYSRNIAFDGTNTNYSSIDYYAYVINQTNAAIDWNNYSPEVVLAQQTSLFVPDSANFSSKVFAPVQQAGTIVNRGALDQLNFSFGGNIDEVLFFGVGIGIPFINYNQTQTFNETALQSDTVYGFQNSLTTSSLRVSGVGFNANFGLIYRPVSWVRVGASYQIPTFYKLSENYSAVMNTNYDTAQYFDYESPQFTSTYNFRAPMKGTLSAAFFLKEYGFLSVDYEFQNFGASHYNFGSGYESVSSELNGYIKTDYAFTHTIRVGVEGAYKWLRVRGGYAFSTSPYSKDYQKNYLDKGYNQVQQTVTAGLGYRGKHFYADLAYLFGFTTDSYTSLPSEYIDNKLVSHRVVLTLGWRQSKAQAQPQY